MQDYWAAARPQQGHHRCSSYCCHSHRCHSHPLGFSVKLKYCHTVPAAAATANFHVRLRYRTYNSYIATLHNGVVITYLFSHFYKLNSHQNDQDWTRLNKIEQEQTRFQQVSSLLLTMNAQRRNSREVCMVNYLHFLWAEMEILLFIHFYPPK